MCQLYVKVFEVILLNPDSLFHVNAFRVVWTGLGNQNKLPRFIKNDVVCPLISRLASGDHQCLFGLNMLVLLCPTHFSTQFVTTHCALTANCVSSGYLDTTTVHYMLHMTIRFFMTWVYSYPMEQRKTLWETVYAPIARVLPPNLPEKISQASRDLEACCFPGNTSMPTTALTIEQAIFRLFYEPCNMMDVERLLTPETFLTMTAHAVTSSNNANDNWKWIFCVCQLFAFKSRLYMLPDEDELGAHARGICGLYIQDLKE